MTEEVIKSRKQVTKTEKQNHLDVVIDNNSSRPTCKKLIRLSERCRFAAFARTWWFYIHLLSCSSWQSNRMSDERANEQHDD